MCVFPQVLVPRRPNWPDVRYDVGSDKWKIKWEVFVLFQNFSHDTVPQHTCWGEIGKFRKCWQKLWLLLWGMRTIAHALPGSVRNGGLERQVHFTGSVDPAAADAISIHFINLSVSVVETYLTRVTFFSFWNLGHNFSAVKGSVESVQWVLFEVYEAPWIG